MYHKCLEQLNPISPAQFVEIQNEQAAEQYSFIEKAIKRANGCLLEIAGGKTPTPFIGNYAGGKEEYFKYVEYLNSTHGQREYELIPDMIHIELCRLDCIDPPSVYADLRNYFLEAGWGENTRVHKRAGSDNIVWLSLEPVEELEDEEDDNLDALRKALADPNCTSTALHDIAASFLLVMPRPRHYGDNKLREIIKNFLANPMHPRPTLEAFQGMQRNVLLTIALREKIFSHAHVALRASTEDLRKEVIEYYGAEDEDDDK